MPRRWPTVLYRVFVGLFTLGGAASSALVYLDGPRHHREEEVFLLFCWSPLLLLVAGRAWICWLRKP